MDRNLHIAHMEFGEVAAFLLSDDDKSEAQESRRKNMEKMTARVRNSNNRVRGGGEWVRQKREATATPHEHKNRSFLAQYAVSEIPSLEQDLTPFPDLVKTG